MKEIANKVLVFEEALVSHNVSMLDKVKCRKNFYSDNYFNLDKLQKLIFIFESCGESKEGSFDADKYTYISNKNNAIEFILSKDKNFLIAYCEKFMNLSSEQIQINN